MTSTDIFNFILTLFFFFFLIETRWVSIVQYLKKKLERFQKDNGRVKSPAIYLFVPIFQFKYHNLQF